MREEQKAAFSCHHGLTVQRSHQNCIINIHIVLSVYIDKELLRKKLLIAGGDGVRKGGGGLQHWGYLFKQQVSEDSDVI